MAALRGMDDAALRNEAVPDGAGWLATTCLPKEQYCPRPLPVLDGGEYPAARERTPCACDHHGSG